MVHICVTAALAHEIDRLFREADWCIGQWQAEDALLRTRPPGDYARIVVDAEVGDAEARRRIDEPHHPILEAALAKALEVIDAARARLPIGHARPPRLVLPEGLVHDVAGDGFTMRRSDRDYVFGLQVDRSAARSSFVDAFMRIVRPSMAEKVPLVKTTTLSPGRIIDSTQSSPLKPVPPTP